MMVMTELLAVREDLWTWTRAKGNGTKKGSSERGFMTAVRRDKARRCADISLALFSMDFEAMDLLGLRAVIHHEHHSKEFIC